MEDAKNDFRGWTIEIDNYLRTLVSLHGLHDWDSIATRLSTVFPMATKTAQECWERWHNSLESVDTKKPWTEQEELQMLVTHQKHQNKWSNMVHELNGRNNNSIKNRFYSIFRKVKNKILKHDLSYESRFELLGILYMISLMENYFENPQPLPKQTGKRGKDFIYSLLKGLQPESVAAYKSEVQRSTGKEVTLEGLWFEIVGQKLVNHSAVPKNNPDSNEINKFPHLPTSSLNERSYCILPFPRCTQSTNVLTPEEKVSFHLQVFQKEPMSAGMCHMTPMITTSYYSPAPYSAGLVPTAPVTTHFEGFSDFTERKQYPTMGNMATPSRPAVMNSEPVDCMRNLPFGHVFM